MNQDETPVRLNPNCRGQGGGYGLDFSDPSVDWTTAVPPASGYSREEQRRGPSEAELANAHNPSWIFTYPLPEDHPSLQVPARARNCPGIVRSSRREPATQKLDHPKGPASDRQRRPSQQTRASPEAPRGSGRITSRRSVPTPSLAVASTPQSSSPPTNERRAPNVVPQHEHPSVPRSLLEELEEEQRRVENEERIAMQALEAEPPASPPTATMRLTVTEDRTEGQPRRTQPIQPPAGRRSLREEGTMSDIMSGGGYVAVSTGGRPAQQVGSEWEVNDFSYEALLELGTLAVPTGLEKAQLDKYKPRPFSCGKEREEAECAVCLEPLEEGQPSLTLACMHAFHHKCIIKWLGRTNRCPTCRFEIPRAQGIRVQ